MNERTDRLWRYRGSAILFQTSLLAWLLSEEDIAIVSLHEGLGWITSPPKVLPLTRSGNVPKTLLLGGLDPILELLPVEEAERFLRARCRRLIGVLQERWGDVGLLFGTNISPDSFRVDHQDQVLMNRGAERELRLSSSLWNGAAGRDLSELKVTDQSQRQGAVEGYYVRRLS